MWVAFVSVPTASLGIFQITAAIDKTVTKINKASLYETLEVVCKVSQLGLDFCIVLIGQQIITGEEASQFDVCLSVRIVEFYPCLRIRGSSFQSLGKRKGSGGGAISNWVIPMGRPIDSLAG